MAKHWLDRNEYPFTSNYFDVDGHRLHFIEEGQGETLLFVHGTPSWSFEYRQIIKDLQTNYRCIAVDHIGFGLSDKPEQYDYSTISHSLTLEKFILTKDLQQITMVVHDFGGPIGLSVAMKYPDRIKGLVILNSWLWSSKTDPEFAKAGKLLRSPLLPFLYRYLNFSARFLLPKSFGDKKISRTTLKQYTRPFANSTQRNGTLAFARSLLNDQDWFEELWSKKASITSKPALLIWGMKDPVIKPRHLAKFQAAFTRASVIQLASSGHYPQEEQPEQVSGAIDRFIKSYE